MSEHTVTLTGTAGCRFTYRVHGDTRQDAISEAMALHEYAVNVWGVEEAKTVHRVRPDDTFVFAVMAVFAAVVVAFCLAVSLLPLPIH